MTHWYPKIICFWANGFRIFLYLICELYFGDLLPDYKSQLQGDKKIREFVKYENICDDLLETTRKYVLKYPRGV